MTETLNKFATLTDQYNQAKADISNQIQEAFKEFSKEIFSKYSALKSFSWHQYTPYFNDGDSCVFRVRTNNRSLELNGLSFYDLGRDQAELELKKSAEEISYILGQIDDEVMLAMYGDHAKITINRDGTAQVDEYHHD